MNIMGTEIVKIIGPGNTTKGFAYYNDSNYSFVRPFHNNAGKNLPDSVFRNEIYVMIIDAIYTKEIWCDLDYKINERDFDNFIVFINTKINAKYAELIKSEILQGNIKKFELKTGNDEVEYIFHRIWRDPQILGFPDTHDFSKFMELFMGWVYRLWKEEGHSLT